MLEKYNDDCQWKITMAVDVVSSCLVSCIDIEGNILWSQSKCLGNRTEGEAYEL